MLQFVPALVIVAAAQAWLFATAACAAPANHQPRMSYLENDAIRLGVDLNLGGAVTYLSPAGVERNVINSWDWGRQVQMSYYAGPVPFTPNGKQPAPVWRGLGWNPVQAGDHFGNASKTVEHSNDGTTLYVKCVPMQWPLDHEPLEGTFESWYTLEGSTVKVRARLNNARSDKTQWPARTQEMPAVYTNGPLHRLFTYSGNQPFTGGALEQIEHPMGKGGSAWAHWNSPENWAALVDDRGWGLGVWNPGCVRFHGGFAGQPGAGGPHDSATGYLGPVRDEILDYDIQHEYSYTLILGELEAIRAHVYRHAARPQPPDYRFARDRQGWHYRNATDAGWPIEGKLRVRLAVDDPQLLGPVGFWQAADAPVLYVRAALSSGQTAAQIFWQRSGEEASLSSMDFQMIGDGTLRTYAVPLSDSPEYRGAIMGLRFDPIPAGKDGDWLEVEWISFQNPAN